MKVTQWFDGKPVHVGVYQSFPTGAYQPILFRYWNGKSFGGFGATAEVADTENHRKIRSSYQSHPWRGLAEKPE